MPGARFTGGGSGDVAALTTQVETLETTTLKTSGANVITNTTASHGLRIANNTTGDSSCEAIDIVSQNEDDTCVGIRGVEKGRGTIKATHDKPPSGASDVNAAALSLRCNGTGTAAGAIFFDAEDGGTTGKLMNLRQDGVERYVVNSDGDISVGGNNLSEFFVKRRAANITTMPDLLAQASMTLATGTQYGALAYALKAGTYGTIRFCTGGTTPAVLTDVRLVVWNASGTVIGETGNISASVTAGNQLVEAVLVSPVALTEQQQVYLGVAWTGTTLQARGAALVTPLAAARGLRTVAEARAGSGYAGGTPNTLGSGATGIAPWLELST